ncbi:MAG: hypothetical protein NTX50_30825 [Candidatus Sumerlaeota bacterium]|nr:hypothetical protein [Candidatus Sumerlaeota bacterium]
MLSATIHAPVRKATISLRDRALTYDQLEQLQQAINSVAKAGKANSISLQSEKIGYGHFTKIKMSVDKTIEAPIKDILSAFGFLERKSGQHPHRNALFQNAQIRKAMKKYGSQAAKSLGNDIRWVLWYNINDAKDVHLLYISMGNHLSKPAEFDTYIFAPDPELPIKGRMFITLSSIKEINCVRKTDLSQIIIRSLEIGDFYTLYGSVPQLRKKLPWAKYIPR